MRNVHERHVHAPPDEAGALLESLGSADDRLWPARAWAPIAAARGRSHLAPCPTQSARVWRSISTPSRARMPESR